MKQTELYTRLGHLPDDVFVVATESLQHVVTALREAEGEPPSLSLLCDVLVAGLHGSAGDFLSDVAPHAVVGLKPEVLSTTKQKVKPGDVVVIPGKDGTWTMALFLYSNRFGSAVGLFEGRHRTMRLPENPKPRFAIYTGSRHLLSGRWRVASHQPELIKLFPAELEIYHEKAKHARNPGVGEFGAAESAAGTIRQLKPGEGESFGFLGQDYSSSYMEEWLEALLDREP